MTLKIGQRVRVHYNLHKKCLSVQDKRTRRVIAHREAIVLSDVKFKVSQSGLKRVRERKCKEVIAVVEGTLVGPSETMDSGNWYQVYFNPYKVDTFVSGDDPITSAETVYIYNKNIYAKGIQCISHKQKR